MQKFQHLNKLQPSQIARVLIVFTWLYHGLFPKLLHVAPLEKALTAGFGFNEQISYWITKSMGVGEIIFGLLFWFYYQNKVLNYLNIAAMVGLIIIVAILMPKLLFEAFNPVTTNLPMIACSLILLAGANTNTSEFKST